MMKKMLFRLASLSCAFALLFSFYTDVGATSGNEIPIPTDHSMEYFQTQSESILAYNRLLDGFEEKNALLATRSNATAEEQKYADYYGGAYINDDGELVVLMTQLKCEINL